MAARKEFIPFVLIVAIMLTTTGCVDDTTSLQQKIMSLEKRLAEQEKAFNEFSTKFDPSNDYGVDIRRIEDQQLQFAETLKEVGPVNSKLEELRSFAEESKKNVSILTEKLNALGQSVSALTKRSEGALRASGNQSKTLDSINKRASSNAVAIHKLEKRLKILRKDVVKNHDNLVQEINNALRLTRTQAAESIKAAVAPLEKKYKSFSSSPSLGGKNGDKGVGQARDDSGKKIRALAKQFKDLKEIVSSQKTYLLELGHKVHELEKAYQQQ
jgi:uncharacterized coiled-coil protein SlyX